MLVVAGSAPLLPIPLWAQSNEPIFRSWRLDEDALSSRAAGLGGAYVAVADDATAVQLNPAGLVNLPRPGDGQFDYIRRASADLPTGDRLRATRSPSASLGLRVNSRWAVGFARHQRVDEIAVGNDCLEEGCEPCRTLPDGTCEWSGLRTKITTYSLAVASRPNWPLKGLNLGVNVGFEQVLADGRSVRDPPSARAPNGWHDFSTSKRLSGLVGALWGFGGFSFGATYRWRATWRFIREPSTFGPPIPGRSPSNRVSYYVAAPGRVSMGMAWRHDWRPLRVLATVEADYLGYGQIASVLTLEPDRKEQYRREDYDVSYAIEPRLGVELTARNLVHSNWRPIRRWSWSPFKAVGLQLRGGGHWPGRSSILYEGPSLSEKMTFNLAKSSPRWAAGAAVTGFFWPPLRVECTRLGGGYRDVWMFGITLRYPGFF